MVNKHVIGSISQLYAHLYQLVEEKLYARVLVGLFLGVILGISLSPDSDLVGIEISQTITSWLAMPGNLFLRLVQMIMIPLVFASIIQGIAGGKSFENLKVIGPKVVSYFILTTIASILVGLAFAFMIQPGKYIDSHKMQASMGEVIQKVEPKSPGKVADLPKKITNVLPSNPLQAMMSGEMLSIVIFSLIVGVALASMPKDNSTPVLQLMFSIQEICMTITRWAMKLAPLAVFGLICQITAKVGFDALSGLGIYILTVLLGLMTLLLAYLVLIKIFSDIKTSDFLRSSKDVLLLAFSVASSAAVIPLSLKTAEDELGVKKSISRFIIPVGATINMNGTALYQAIATIFLAQVFGLELNFMSIVLIVATTVAASIGTPSSPGAGIVILATVLSSVGIPVAGVALIIGVDSLLGMSRAAVNVAGDLTACVVFNSRGLVKEKD
jgi:Na+/H+-dicarboxylate symporter